MKNVLLSTLEASAHGARLSGAEIVPDFPEPFSSDIVKALEKMHECKIIQAESQSSALNIAVGSALGSKRAFLPLSVPKRIDEFYNTSFLRIPVVAANVSQSIFTRTTKYDHNNILSIRDAGWLLFFPSTTQEIIDSIMQAYHICENIRVLLPGMVNIGLPAIRETIQMPSDQFGRNMVAKFRLPHKINMKNHKTIVPVDNFDEFVGQQQAAMSNAIKLFEKMDEKYTNKLKRPFGMVEQYKTNDADYVIIMAGFNSEIAKRAVDKMREQGKNVGLLRLRVIRPWPEHEINKAVENVKKIAVFDENISLGRAGILFSEMNISRFMNNYISLGKTSMEKTFMDIISHLEKSEKPERVWL